MALPDVKEDKVTYFVGNIKRAKEKIKNEPFASPRGEEFQPGRVCECPFAES